MPSISVYVTEEQLIKLAQQTKEGTVTDMCQWIISQALSLSDNPRFSHSLGLMFNFVQAELYKKKRGKK